MECDTICVVDFDFRRQISNITLNTRFPELHAGRCYATVLRTDSEGILTGKKQNLNSLFRNRQTFAELEKRIDL